MFDVVFSETAENDLDEIAEWYEAIRQGLKDEFLLCVEGEVEIIRRAPLIYSEYFLNVRKAKTNKFPYGIYYMVEDKRVVILAIAHQKRSIRVIKKKIKA